MAARYLIVGGGIAGTTAAEVIRGRDRDGEITIISDEPYRLYSRIVLSKPNFFLEKMPFVQVWLKDASWYTTHRIRLLAPKSAVALDPAAKTVSLDDGTNLPYDKILFAIGARARRWTVQGSERRGVYYLRTLDDAKAIIAAVKTAKRAVAVGGGFVSFEMCDMLRQAGIDVTLVLRESYYWEPLLDEESGHIIERALEKGGVTILRQAEVQSVSGTDVVTSVTLKDGREIPCDMIIVGIGVVCPFQWLAEAGVKVNRGILANEYLETSVENAWVAGDAAEFNDVILHERVQLGNWVNAQMQGRAAAMNMTGDRTPFRMVSFYTTQGFGITIAFIGDVRPAPNRSIIGRGSGASGSYGRILLKDGEMIGATLINRTFEMGALTKLIENNVKVSGREAELADPHTNLTQMFKPNG